ncbi:MAG: nucleotide exchange factor GrpE, partial [Candidatus Methanomethylophilaceae archaeon]|nr:nucleotide exchange factor GrpE [Candidatus Methanomethylophilaceae archaeon]
MSERFSNILSGKFQQVDPRQGVNVKVPDEAEFEAQKAEQAREIEASAPVVRNNDDLKEMISSLKSQIEELRASVDSIRSTPAEMPDMSAFVTTREQVKSLTNAIDRQNVEITNKQLVNAMGQISAMREDFFKLCSGMENKIDTMSAKEVLDSFRAYEVDMENILTDGGVFIGHFPYETLNTIHQRIVDVVPTDDPEKNGKIAERLSDGYKLGDRVL